MFQIDMLKLQEIQAQANEPLQKVLLGFQRQDPGLADMIRPQPGDWARVFVPGAAEQLEQAYAPMWGNPKEQKVRIGPDQSRITSFFALSQMFGYENPAAQKFPGGYRQVSHLLQPDRLWVAFRFHRPDSRLGMFFDGLVWLDDRFGWFPKPWRAAARSSQGTYIN